MKLGPNQFIYQLTVNCQRPSLGGGIGGGQIIVGTEIFDDEGNFVRIDGSAGMPLESLAGETIDDKFGAALQPVIAAQAADLVRKGEEAKATATKHAELQSQIDALGGTELAKKLARENRIAELAAAKAAIEAEHAELTSGSI